MLVRKCWLEDKWKHTGAWMQIAGWNTKGATEVMGNWLLAKVHEEVTGTHKLECSDDNMCAGIRAAGRNTESLG